MKQYGLGMIAVGWVLTIGAMPCFGANWETLPVDYGRWFEITSQSMALDNDRNPHVVYAGKGLYYSYFDGEFWQREIVFDDGCDIVFPAIALDRNSQPHVLYLVKTPVYGPVTQIYELWYIRRIAGQWIRERIAESIIGTTIPVVIGNDDLVHVAYYSTIGSDYAWQRTLMYTFGQPGVWRTDQIQRNLYQPQFSLCMGEDSVPYLLYRSYSEGSDVLRLIGRRSGSWHQEALIQTGDNRYSDLAIDPEGRFHIAYGKNDTWYHVWGSGDSWTSETVSETENLSGIFLSLGSDSRICIGGPRASGADSGYMIFTKDGDQWLSESVDPGMAYFPGVAGMYDSNGSLRLLGIRNPSGELIAARSEADGWLFEKLDNRGSAGSQLEAAYDAAGHLRIVYTCNGENQLRTAVYDGNHWTREILDDNLGMTNKLGFCIDALNRSHICYHSSASGTMKYLRQNGEGWDTEIVNSELDCAGISMALQPDQQPAVLYVTNGNLVINRRDAAGQWNEEWISDQAYAATGLMIRHDGKVMLVFYRRQTTEYWYVVYAENTSGIWQFTDIASTLSCAASCSIRMDSANRPHIAYVTNQRYGCTGYMNYFYHATLMDDGWEADLIHAGFDDIYRTRWAHVHGMSLDGDGNPSFVYQNDMGAYLVRWMDDEWSYSWLSDEMTPTGMAQNREVIDAFSYTDTVLAHSRYRIPRVGVRLEMPGRFFERYDTCGLMAHIYKASGVNEPVRLVVCLEYGGQYWFYPSWTPAFGSASMDIDQPLSSIEIIETFDWPYGIAFHASGLTFWGAMLDQSMTRILGGSEGLGSFTFSF